MRRVFLDACVLAPPLMREVVLGAAAAGAFAPLWSGRVLEEWARVAARRDGPEGETLARGDMALMRARWPGAEVAGREAAAAALALRQELPDPDDAHVLAAAQAGEADVILTLNLKDFPRRMLAGLGLAAAAPDPFLWSLWPAHDAALTAVLDRARTLTRVEGREPEAFRRALKRAGLPRLARLWLAAQDPL